MVMRQILPGSALVAVVLTNGSPSSLTEVGSPSLPVCRTSFRLLQPLFFCCHAAFPFECRKRTTPLLMKCLCQNYPFDYLSSLMDCSNGNGQRKNAAARPECDPYRMQRENYNFIMFVGVTYSNPLAVRASKCECRSREIMMILAIWATARLTGGLRIIETGNQAVATCYSSCGIHTSTFKEIA